MSSSRCPVDRHSAFRYVRAGPPSPRNWVLSHAALLLAQTGNSYRQSPRTQRSPSAIAITGKIAGRLCLQRDDYWKKGIVGYRKHQGTPARVSIQALIDEGKDNELGI